MGPLPFGHVRDLSRDDWQREVKRLQPDVIYALLNWQAVPFAAQVARENPGIPFVWHFKEGPFICLEKGTWPDLADLYALSDGQIFSSPEMRDWFLVTMPGLVDEARALVLDGDLPKREWFRGEPAPRLSASDGEIHTVIPGRPIGLHPSTIAELAALGIHVHFYGDFTHGQWREWIQKARGLAPRHLHLHRQVDQDGWVRHLSQYDAGWLHVFASENRGELRRANWDDLNYPARISTYAAAGLPMIQLDNCGSIVATQALCEALGIGVLFRDLPGLAVELANEERMAACRARLWQVRDRFTFDAHADRLVAFFREIIALGRRPRPARPSASLPEPVARPTRAARRAPAL